MHKRQTNTQTSHTPNRASAAAEIRAHSAARSDAVILFHPRFAMRSISVRISTVRVAHCTRRCHTSLFFGEAPAHARARAHAPGYGDSLGRVRGPGVYGHAIGSANVALVGLDVVVQHALDQEGAGDGGHAHAANPKLTPR